VLIGLSVIELKLPFPPSANAYWRYVQGRVLVSARAKAYKRAIGYLCLTQNIQALDGKLQACVRFYPPDRRRRDGHNLSKVLFDALEGYLYQNDSQLIDVRLILMDDIVTNGLCCLKISPIA
jgi:crossover junction endodeoxyribonuclease RusA